MELFTETNRTYATYANAKRAFEKAVGDYDIDHLIQATEDGRFKPVAVIRRDMEINWHYLIDKGVAVIIQ